MNIEIKKIDFEVTLENYADDIRQLYTILRPTAKREEIHCKAFDIGIMNRVVKMEDPTNDKALVFRIFRLKLLQALSAEEREKDKNKCDPTITGKALELECVKRASEQSITVQLCATFHNGFVYEYADGDMLTAEIYDLETAKRIGATVAKLHRMELGNLKTMLRERPLIYSSLGLESDPKELKKECDFFDAKMKQTEFDEFRSHLPSYTELCDELVRIHQILLAKDAYGPVCFCHNDLNITNWVIERNTKKPILLDFEWVSIAGFARSFPRLALFDNVLT